MNNSNRNNNNNNNILNISIIIKVLTNKIINKKIFYYVQLINRFHHKGHHLHKWFRIKDRPDILAQYGYIDELRRYYNKVYLSRRFTEDERNSLMDAMAVSITFNQFTTLKFLVEEISFKQLKIDITQRISEDYDDTLIEIAAENGLKDIVIYLDNIVTTAATSSSTSPSSKWDYSKVFILISRCNDLELCKSIKSKCNLNSISNQTNAFLSNAFQQQFINHNSNSNNNNSSSTTNKIIDIFEWALDNLNLNYLNGSVWRSAVEFGNLDLLNYMYDKKPPILRNWFRGSPLIDESISFGKIDVIEWLFERNAVYQNYTDIFTKYIESGGSIELLQCLHRNLATAPPPPPVITIYGSSSCGTLDYYQNYIVWFYQNCVKLDISIMDCAVSNGRLDIVRWLHDNVTSPAPVIKPNAIRTAICEGNIEMVDWILKNRTERIDARNQRVIETRYNYLDYQTAVYLLNNLRQCVPSYFLTLSDPFLLRYTYENFPHLIETNHIVRAASFGYFGIVKHLHSELIDQIRLLFLKRKKSTTSNSSNNTSNDNNDNILMKQYQCMIDIYQSAIYHAANNYQMEIVKFLCEVGPIAKCLGDASNIKVSNPMVVAISNGYTLLVEYLHKNTIYKCTDHYLETVLTKVGHIDVLVWLYENTNLRMSAIGIEKIVKNGHYQIIEYILKTTDFKPTNSLLQVAVNNKHLEIAKLLVEIGGCDANELKITI